jgi:hypothetical protein
MHEAVTASKLDGDSDSTYIGVGHQMCGYGFDQIVFHTPINIENREWVNACVLTRLLPK